MKVYSVSMEGRPGSGINTVSHKPAKPCSQIFKGGVIAEKGLNAAIQELDAALPAASPFYARKLCSEFLSEAIVLIKKALGTNDKSGADSLFKAANGVMGSLRVASEHWGELVRRDYIPELNKLGALLF